jgi:uncharacterized lipoprotein YddW (UPF0748 family)
MKLPYFPVHFSLKHRFPKLTVILSLLLLCNIPLFITLPASGQDSPESGPSILRPNQSVGREYRFPLDIANPSPASNPRGAAFPGYRGENQLILYTTDFGSSTGTNNAGIEAIVSNGVIIQTADSNAPIPQNGFVISGHGSAALWLSKFGKPGAQVGFDQTRQEIVIRLTPSVYLHQVDEALKRAESREPANPEAYHHYLQQAKNCRGQLANLENQPLTSEITALGEQCYQDANRAFYNTIRANPAEFRGVWIRPSGTQPAQITKVIESLKKSHIGHVFLETYFQGKTAYPSQVMAEYGLPDQHPQYRGGDPVQLWIEAAHKEGIKVHLWTQVFFAGNSRENSELYGPILNKYPEWRNVQRTNWNVKTPVISDIEPGHYFLDPANPEVRIFLEKLLLEMVNRYDADGINLDYIRYPASAAVNKSIYLNTTWGYTETARRQFQSMIDAERKITEQQRLEALKKAGKPATPAPQLVSSDPKDFSTSHPLWNRWVAWRKDQVSSFVKNISAKTHAVKPNLLISAVVFPSADTTYAQKLQDYPRWANEGSIQALTPIGLSAIPERMYQQSLKLKAQVQDKVPVYIGVFGLYNRAEPIELVQQIDAIHQADMPGLVLFDWSRLTPAYEEALLEGPFRQ